MQLELFKKTFEEETESNIQNIETRLDNLRKGIFKRHGELSNLISSLQKALDRLECQVRLITKSQAGVEPAQPQQLLLDSLL